MSAVVPHPIQSRKEVEWPNKVFLVDRFHQQSTHVGENTHVARFCQEYCNAENPHYPGLVNADGDKIGNSEAAEQCFARLVNFGGTAMNMSYVNCRHYIFFMVETLNEVLARRLEKRGKGVRPRPNLAF